MKLIKLQMAKHHLLNQKFQFVIDEIINDCFIQYEKKCGLWTLYNLFVDGNGTDSYWCKQVLKSNSIFDGASKI